MSGTDELFPETAIGYWLDATGIAPGAPVHFERIAGGRSNVMFRVTRGDRRFVLRRPTRVAIEKANDGIRREFRVLTALADSDVPHPEAIALCDDTGVIGCAFYVMQEVEGTPATGLPAELGPAEVVRPAVTFSLTDALAALHEVDWRANGLTDFGQPDGFHERQVDRWTSQYRGYGGRELPQVDVVGTWLEQDLPGEWSPTILHADYHMLNVIIAPDLPVRVAAIVDWETATIGDPLLDLAGFCEVWCGAYSGDGWPARSEIIGRYADRRGLGSGSCSRASTTARPRTRPAPTTRWQATGRCTTSVGPPISSPRRPTDRRSAQFAQPPSITWIWPVVKLDSSLAR